MKKIERQITKITAIRFNNEHGGKYAYMQFLAYSRELNGLLRAIPSSSRFTDKIEAVNWLFNEYLQTKFAHRHQVIFENEMMELRGLFSELLSTLKARRRQVRDFGIIRHAQAA